MKRLVKKITDFFDRIQKKQSDKLIEQQEMLKIKMEQKILSKKEKLANCTVKKEQKQLEKEIKVLEKLERKLNEE
ncbi:hypothetical protein [Sulfuricurvum sp.]|uniref:hypothetical protein n=1 Tax=Sulfuricurvum sp. TaxID=2025608 RepID=UPI00262A64FE|nr:hypothetical protein [Sulfuricurvum sp.]MDD2781025.1 hypothetical protein [Sulfuricurvum sp.]